MDKKRITTAKTRIKPITTGKFCRQEGYTPSYVLAPSGQKLSRVRLLATVVDKYVSETGKFAAVTIDDGTDTIRVKVFNAISMFESIAPGDIIDVIGRIKEYNGEVYVMPEIITKSKPDMEILREMEVREAENNMRKVRDLVLQYKSQTADMAELARMMKERFGVDEEVTESVLSVQEPQQDIDVKGTVLQLIAKLDTGQGCDYTELLEASGLPEESMDSVVNELLESGACFEPKPGKIKKL